MAKEFPGTLLEFERWFRTEESCRSYLERIRWPEGFVCPRCQARKAWHSKNGLFHCQGCYTNTYLTAGTVFHRSKVPLRLWYRAMWWMTNQKMGINAMGLQRLFGLPSYQTAWTMLHKLRRAMIRPGREQLSGDVEVDETLIGGFAPGDQGRQEKNIVIIAAEIQGKGIGRIRLAKLPDETGTPIVNFIKTNVAKGALIVSDGEWAYSWLTDEGYRHQRIPRAGSKELPRVHRVASLLKRWLLGTFQGRASDKQLQHYLDEYAFRFNRRNSALRGQLFYQLVQQCAGSPPTTYHAMTRSS
ncbi:MAG: IS1595 family transposase [Elusimicrobia bacterium]|nr:IS1595 family transposase [Elusimicrobiota bacterium]